MEQFFTWEMLATVAGCTAATAYVTQFLKKIEYLNKINTQLISYIVAVVILIPATYFTGSLSASTAFMIPFNAIVVAFSANGAYDSVKSTVNASSKAATEIMDTITSTIQGVAEQIESIKISIAKENTTTENKE